MNAEERFLVRCKMTCFGGSERGTCPCECPNDCREQSDPKYKHYRNEAIARMGRYLRNGLVTTSPTNVDPEKP